MLFAMWASQSDWPTFRRCDLLLNDLSSSWTWCYSPMKAYFEYHLPLWSRTKKKFELEHREWKRLFLFMWSQHNEFDLCTFLRNELIMCVCHLHSTDWFLTLKSWLCIKTSYRATLNEWRIFRFEFVIICLLINQIVWIWRHAY